MLSGGKKFIFRKNAFRKDVFSLCFLRFPHFGSKTDFLMKFLDDSAAFLPEKLKNQVFFQSKPEYLTHITKIFQKSKE